VTEEHAGAWTPRIIRARPEEVYAAFLDPAALIDWRPPAEMAGEIRIRSAGRGGYRLSLFCPPDERAFRGKIIFVRSPAARSHLLREGDELV
jgi:uncharacterized protein YndB with AHSA1/START domain